MKRLSIHITHVYQAVFVFIYKLLYFIFDALKKAQVSAEEETIIILIKQFKSHGVIF